MAYELKCTQALLEALGGSVDEAEAELLGLDELQARRTWRMPAPTAPTLPTLSAAPVSCVYYIVHARCTM